MEIVITFFFNPDLNESYCIADVSIDKLLLYIPVTEAVTTDDQYLIEKTRNNNENRNLPIKIIT